MRIIYGGKPILFIKVYQWPNNCGYLILDNYSFTYESPESIVKQPQFVIDVIATLFPKYRKVLVTGHSVHSARKVDLGGIDGVTTIDKTFSKYNDDEKNMLHFMSFAPDTFKLDSLADVGKKYELLSSPLTATLLDFHEQDAYRGGMATVNRPVLAADNQQTIG